MKTLFERLKPAAKKKLLKSKFSATAEMIHNEIAVKTSWNELTILCASSLVETTCEGERFSIGLLADQFEDMT